MRRIPPALVVLIQVVCLSFLASCEGCKKKPPPTVEDDVPRREVAELTVEGIEPASMDEGAMVEVTVSGTEFHAGATVDIGGYRAGNVRVVDGGTLRASIPASLPAGTHDVRVTNTDGATGLLRGAFTVRARRETQCSLQTVHFDYDKSDLDDASRALLAENARCIQQRGHTRVSVEGHCDERGSTDYNLALGQRRADSVARYLVDLGVGPSVLKALSYGEEKPVDARSTEDAWSRNRRAELVPGR